MLMKFGKYKGCRVDEVVQKAPEYILWLEENIAYKVPEHLTDAYRQALKDFREFEYNQANAWAWGFGKQAKNAWARRRARQSELQPTS
jgi:hypothetical protein